MTIFNLLLQTTLAFAPSAAVASESVQLNILMQDSKVVYTSRVNKFSLKVGNLNLPCRERAFVIDSDESLYATGWDVSRSRTIGGNGKYRVYHTAVCRNADTVVQGWFGQERLYEFSVSEQFVSENYQPKSLPLILQLKSLKNGETSYFKCAGDFSKKAVAESEKSITYAIVSGCEASPKPSDKVLAPIDFLNNPGELAAIMSYRNSQLPAVASDEAAMKKVTTALLSKVPAGRYKGAMSTLGKTCEVEISEKDGVLHLVHTMTSTKKARSRKLELQAANLQGAVDGVLYKDPIRVEEKSVGVMSAAEFVTEKNEPLVVRFENRTDQEGLTVRINGPETYCRRLIKIQ